MSKDNKNKNNRLLEISKTMFAISIIALITYALMAVITHFSLNFKLETYTFKESIYSIFDIKTAMFKFFAGFMILNAIWILSAVLINYIKKTFY